MNTIMPFIAAISFIICLIILRALTSKKKIITSKHLGTTINAKDRSYALNQWHEIIDLAQIYGTSTSHEAVIKADKLLDYVLGKMGFKGSIGEKLKQSRHRFSSRTIYNQAWSAHKMRNTIVHESGFDLTKAALKHTLSDYESVFKDLSAI